MLKVIARNTSGGVLCGVAVLVLMGTSSLPRLAVPVPADAYSEVISQKSPKALDTQLWVAVVTDDEPRVESLLQNGAKVDAFLSGTGDRYTPLICAAGKNVSIVRLLISHGADVNAASSKGYSALHVAAAEGIRQIVDILLTHGADVNARDSQGITALDLAAEAGRNAIVHLLIAKGASTAMCDGKGNTALHYAAWAGNASTVEVLLDAGSDLEARNAKGETPLAIAARTGNTDVAVALLRHGATLRPGGTPPATPAMIAVRNHHTATAVAIAWHQVRVCVAGLAAIVGIVAVWGAYLLVRRHAAAAAGCGSVPRE